MKFEPQWSADDPSPNYQLLDTEGGISLFTMGKVRGVQDWIAEKGVAQIALMRIALVVGVVVLPERTLAVMCAEEKKPAKMEKLSDQVRRLIYADVGEEWEVTGRGKVQFVPSPPPTREEPKPRQVDVRRGYLVFSPEGRGRRCGHYALRWEDESLCPQGA